MPFVTYAETRPWAKAIREQALARKMPPWFADPSYGHFANDRSLSQSRDRHDRGLGKRGRARRRSEGCSAAAPVAARLEHRNARCGLRNAGAVPRFPAKGAIDYQYVILPTHFTEDKWIQRVEVRPSNRATVHHAVVYIREPGSKWLEGQPRGTAFSVPGSPKASPPAIC